MNTENPFDTSENPFSDPYVPSNDASFLTQCQRIKDDIEQYRSNVDYIKQLQYQQMNSVSESEKKRTLNDIDSATMDLKISQTNIKNSIENLKFQVNRSDPDMVNQLNNLNRLFRGALREMIVEEDNFKEAVTNQAVEQYQIINPEASYHQAQEFVLQNGPDEIFSTSLEMQNKKAEAMEVYQNVKYRHDELLKIQEMAATLNQMFNDLQDIVLEQDQYINSASDQINTAQMELEKGDANVIQAVHTSKKNRKCKWIIFALCLLLAAIIAGIIAGLVKGLSGH
jgi:syntaxin 1B/2/3